jgi:hypothetical protein
MIPSIRMLSQQFNPAAYQPDDLLGLRRRLSMNPPGTSIANARDNPMATKQHAILRGILAYLSEHPNAQDTVEGIAEWWLLRQRIRESVTATEQALNELVERGLVIRDAGADGRRMYRLNQWKLQVVREVLNQTGRKPNPERVDS